MSDEGRLEKFRQRLERGAADYQGCGAKLHEASAERLSELSGLCDGMMRQARRVLKTECSVERIVMPYSLTSDTFVVRHVFYQDRHGSITVDVTFARGQFAFGGAAYAVNEYPALLDAVADEVLSFYLPR